MNIFSFDKSIISFAKRYGIQIARVAFFIVFFWFGILKVLGTSPANPLVQALMETTLPFLTFTQFIIFFGLFEMIIGILFLFPRYERLVIPLFLLHMFTTSLPLFLLTNSIWQSFLVPTLEGQYIIKNLVLVALAIVVVAHLKPMRHDK